MSGATPAPDPRIDPGVVTEVEPLRGIRCPGIGPMEASSGLEAPSEPPDSAPPNSAAPPNLSAARAVQPPGRLARFAG
eukprot:CAMPEP_0179906198 /NCGR_PEP_ID=MMETSP0982-20121206/43062_1 /TAXON_ID=483367 /ORGANISM="non described non described, Strain CCMP 2436" /LENGTH=77 /DNA_ID=CAMNT_0021806581 /DNA_START=443 /DNA_END=677 /DNA_ORIENTATION=+